MRYKWKHEYNPGECYEWIKDDCTFLVVLLSTEPEDDFWLAAEFQEYEMGAQITELCEERLRGLFFLGTLKHLIA